ncbi:hypothetical protein F2P81_007268 [Scophthalmus maximus]|uniref:Uncharacterized protein n=1 Tax=Scophthalmus maximus TaxID=52904 RepID=A0A6A4TC29_SCOMX|nr:hypothetical protein F2P81_007268 [Scophthalmus maximus]
MSRKQLMGTSPQQSSVPDVIHDTTTGTTTGDRSRNGNKVDSALFRQRNVAQAQELLLLCNHCHKKATRLP